MIDFYHVMLPNYFFIIEAVLFGLVIGSFLNVCIYRIPLRQSLGGRSFCPHCHWKISWYDNIPIFSYLILLGRCRACKNKISLQYPLVEIVSAGLSVMTLVQNGYHLPPYFIWYLLFVSPLVVLSVIDWRHRILPDVITVPGLVIGFLVILYLRAPFYKEALFYSLAGMLAGGGTLFFLGWIYYLIRKREGMGGGDVKLSAMLGAFLGWKGMVFVFLISSVLAVIYGVVALFFAKNEEEGPMIIPYGPFLSVAALIYYFYGYQITSFYFNLVGFPQNPLN